MSIRPSDYPTPFTPREFVSEPTDPLDERIEVGILIVGAGPAGLACAIRLGQLVQESPDLAERLGEVPVAVLEKGKQPGSHSVSGAVVNPRGLRRLFRGTKRVEDMPFYGEVETEGVYFLRAKTAMRIPTPPTMKNHGNYVTSLSQLPTLRAQVGSRLVRRVGAGAVQPIERVDRHRVAIEEQTVRRGEEAGNVREPL